MTAQALFYIGMAVYFVVSVGLLIDRYWLMEDRILDAMIEKTNKDKRCVICGRPMTIGTEENK